MKHIIVKTSFCLILSLIVFSSMYSMGNAAPAIVEDPFRTEEDLLDEVIFRVSALPHDLTLGFVKFDNFSREGAGSYYEGEKILGNAYYYNFTDGEWIDSEQGLFAVGNFGDVNIYDIQDSYDYTYEGYTVCATATNMIQYSTMARDLEDYIEIMGIYSGSDKWVITDNFGILTLNETDSYTKILLEFNPQLGFLTDVQYIYGYYDSDYKYIECMNYRVSMIESITKYTQDVVRNTLWDVEKDDTIIFNYTDGNDATKSGFYRYTIAEIKKEWMKVDQANIFKLYIDEDLEAQIKENEYYIDWNDTAPQVFVSNVYAFCSKWNNATSEWLVTEDIFDRTGKMLIASANREMVFPLDEQYPPLILPINTDVDWLAGLGREDIMNGEFLTIEDVKDVIDQYYDTTQLDDELDDMIGDYNLEYTVNSISGDYEDYFLNWSWNPLTGQMKYLYVVIPAIEDIEIQDHSLVRVSITDIPNYHLPVANFTAIATGLTVNVTSTSTSTETIVEYIWNWGDGNTTTTTSNKASHTYTAEGSYNITLTIKDASNNEASVMHAVIVDEESSTTWVWGVAGSVAGVSFLAWSFLSTSGKKAVGCKINKRFC